MTSTPPTDLSFAQIRVLDLYRRIDEKEQRPPTYEEAARKLGVSKNAVSKTVRILEEKGYVRRRPGMRNVILTDKAQ